MNRRGEACLARLAGGLEERARQASPLRVVLLLPSLLACQFTPLMNRLAVGEEPIIVFVAEAADGSTDLFAVSAGGSSVHQLTYNRPVESHPALSPDGSAVAFLRRPLRADSTGNEVTLMNLLNAAERQFPLPEEAGAVLRVAWTRDGGALVVRTTRGPWRIEAPPADADPRPLAGTEAAQADTLLAVALGQPVFALVKPCEGQGLCVHTVGGEVEPLTSRGSGAFRWGVDSVAWFEQERIEVRPLGPGLSRQVMWTRVPRNPREATYAAASGPPRQPETGLVAPPPRGSARQ